MAAGFQAIYPCAANAAPVLIVNTANTNRDGTGTITTVFTAGANAGARIDRIYLKATGVTTAGMLRIFVKVAAGTYRLVDEVLVAAVASPGATTMTWQGVWTPSGASGLLNAGSIIGIATHNAEEFTAWPSGGDF